MARRWLVTVVLSVVALLMPVGSALAQCILYAGQAADEDERDLLILDVATGLGTPVGDIGAETTGLAYNTFNGIMYGSTAQIVTGTLPNEALITIDLTTGEGTEVGEFNVMRTMADLAFDATTGLLYGWRAQSTGDLYTIDLMTGMATLVGESGLDLSGGQGLTFGPGNRLYLAGEGTEGRLWTIDKMTGLPISSRQLSGYSTDDNINALAFDGKTIYGVTNGNSELITIDPNSGHITTIGHAGVPEEDNVDAIEFVCRQASPAAHHLTLVVIAAGLLAIGVAVLRGRLRESF